MHVMGNVCIYRCSFRVAVLVEREVLVPLLVLRLVYLVTESTLDFFFLVDQVQRVLKCGILSPAGAPRGGNIGFGYPSVFFMLKGYRVSCRVERRKK